MADNFKRLREKIYPNPDPNEWRELGWLLCEYPEDPCNRDTGLCRACIIKWAAGR